jgi:predicted short-subunit dehydrogenase-like oxidoreductase (DUF2520 family)
MDRGKEDERATELRLVSRKRELERHLNQDERDIPALAIIGAGRAGRAIHRAARAAGVDSRLGGRGDARSVCEGAEVALLCVPDAAIEGACEAIADVETLRFVGHTSGAVGAGSLAAAAAAGAETFALHPLQTITDRDPELIGASCAVAGSSPETLELAVSLARRLGMRPFELPDDARAAYHAAASIASNFLVALEESAAQLLARAGIADGRELLAPLVLRSAANWSSHGAEALTGPIARGDEATVDAHLTAIEEQMPELLDLYRALAERTREIAGAEVAA